MIQVSFPDVQDRYTLSPECEAVIDLMCSMTGSELVKWWSQQIDKLGKIDHKYKPLTPKWFARVGDVPQGVKYLRAGFNIAFIAVVLEAIDWTDKVLCASLFHGFQLYGDLTATMTAAFFACYHFGHGYVPTGQAQVV